MSKKIKYKAGEYVYSKKQRMTSVITATREYGAYIKRPGTPLCCPWDDLTLATKEQKREYIISQNAVRAAAKAKEQSLKVWEFRPFHGGTPIKVTHKVIPKVKDIRMIKDILRYLNTKCAQRNPERSEGMRYPISAVWHQPGTEQVEIILGNGRGIKTKDVPYGYGWVLVSDWMMLTTDHSFMAYIKGINAKYKTKGLQQLDFVFFIHNKVRYSGLLSIRPTESMKHWKLPNQ